ncbi:hypothetical protein HanIR_Chr14g0686021 [Helianthus annuus]|nr:hypothetical protein HanIR_Chr14g0686021 [Helianthus annuus]
MLWFLRFLVLYMMLGMCFMYERVVLLASGLYPLLVIKPRTSGYVSSSSLHHTVLLRTTVLLSVSVPWFVLDGVEGMVPVSVTHHHLYTV